MSPGATRVVAVDGPGGSGKSTVSRAVAERLGWAHLDTGAYYRTATLAVLEAGADPTREAEVMAALGARRLEQRDGEMRLDGRDVSLEIRTQEIDEAVSAVSAHPRLRAAMVELQRAWVDDHGGRAVVEGRDIGSVVFPDAFVKVYLTARPDVRAGRRAGQTGATADDVARELARRDDLDSSRRASPLRVAADAVVVDTSELGVEEVVDRVLRLVRERSRQGI